LSAVGVQEFTGDEAGALKIENGIAAVLIIAIYFPRA
jgi:hypothetical protein